MFLCFTSFHLSASAWRDSPLSFKTASGKLLAAGAVKDRLLCIYLSAAELSLPVFCTENKHFDRNVIPQKHPLPHLYPLSLSLFHDGLQYLTTVIPYEKKGHPPSLEDLQILTKSEFLHLHQQYLNFCVWLIHSLLCICCLAVLQAMRDDSDKVPSLLTDYILKGELFLFYLHTVEVGSGICWQVVCSVNHVSQKPKDQWLINSDCAGDVKSTVAFYNPLSMYT